VARKGLPKKYAKMGFKRGWRAFKAAKRKRSTTKRRALSSPRRANNPKRRNMARKFVTPHPSITGMAAGFSIFDDLNGGNGASVTDLLMQGKLSSSVTELGKNAQNLVKTQTGRTALVQAVGIAAIGAWARKALPGTKIGSTRHYFRI